MHRQNYVKMTADVCRSAYERVRKAYVLGDTLLWPDAPADKNKKLIELMGRIVGETPTVAAAAAVTAPLAGLCCLHVLPVLFHIGRLMWRVVWRSITSGASVRV